MVTSKSQFLHGSNDEQAQHPVAANTDQVLKYLNK